MNIEEIAEKYDKIYHSRYGKTVYESIIDALTEYQQGLTSLLAEEGGEVNMCLSCKNLNEPCGVWNKNNGITVFSCSSFESVKASHTAQKGGA